ncbi:Hypothetical protein A7982_08301 [Minicystis rosea]|nr:Hypothetical protein A7982_08301 [Minicystis rosea]
MIAERRRRLYPVKHACFTAPRTTLHAAVDLGRSASAFRSWVMS